MEKIIGLFRGRAPAREALELVATLAGAKYDPLADEYLGELDGRSYRLKLRQKGPKRWQIVLDVASSNIASRGSGGGY